MNTSADAFREAMRPTYELIDKYQSKWGLAWEELFRATCSEDLHFSEVHKESDIEIQM